MDTYRNSSASTMNSTSEGTGLRKALRRWKDRWRVSSYSSPKSSIRSTSSSRPPSNMSSSATAPAPTSHPSCLSPVPGSLLPVPDALFTATTQTFIHSPADPRSRTGSMTSSPAVTLRKSPPISRRNTTPPEHLHGLVPSHSSPSPGGDILPMNTVTTTIVAGNDTLHKKRSSRFRLSISKSRSSVSPSPNSPSSANLFDRSSSRATGRFDALEETKELTPRKRADTKVSDPEVLPEEGKGGFVEAETPKKVDQPGNMEKPETTEMPEKTENDEKTLEKQRDAEVEVKSEDAPVVEGPNSTIRMVEVGA